MGFPRYWNYIDCINSSDISLIETTIIEILSKEGFTRSNSLPKSILKLIEECTKNPLSQSYWQLAKEILIIGLFPGASGWTIVQTNPVDFMCRRAKNSSKPRLSELTARMNCKAFHWSVYQDYWGILLEANEKSDVFVSGGHPIDKKSEENLYYQEPIDYKERWKFHLIDIPENIQEAIRAETKEEFETRSARLDKLYILEDSLDNRILEELEIDLSVRDIDIQAEIRELLIERSGTTTDRVLREYIGNCSRYWGKCLYYISVQEEEQIQTDGGKLLYFHTPKYYQQSKDFFELLAKYG